MIWQRILTSSNGPENPHPRKGEQNLSGNFVIEGAQHSGKREWKVEFLPWEMLEFMRFKDRQPLDLRGDEKLS